LAQRQPNPLATVGAATFDEYTLDLIAQSDIGLLTGLMSRSHRA
jgi:hypothetical protein